MLGKKLKILICTIITAIQTFAYSMVQANNLFILENDSPKVIILAEALVEYPFGWFYTLDEIEEFYEVEYYDNNRLESFIHHENGKHISQCDNELSQIPEKFIKTTLELLKHMLDRKLAKYLFRLDTFHGHFFVTDKQFEKKYSNRNALEMMQELVNDDSLGVLFHCAEHLAIRNPLQTGYFDKEAEKLIKQRSIIGWYNTGSIEVVNPPKKELVGSGKSNTATIPQGFRKIGFITFRANINGEYNIKHAGQTIWLDLSLCDCYYY